MSDDTQGAPASELPRAIGRPAMRALALAGYTRLEQLAAVSDQELLGLHGVGPKAVRLLREELAARGLGFAPNAERHAGNV